MLSLNLLIVKQEIFVFISSKSESCGPAVKEIDSWSDGRGFESSLINAR